MIKQKYGVVYTPDTLSEFVATLLERTVGDTPIRAVLDPASGECSLLNAAKNAFGEQCEYIGIDVDQGLHRRGHFRDQHKAPKWIQRDDCRCHVRRNRPHRHKIGQPICTKHG